MASIRLKLSVCFTFLFVTYGVLSITTFWGAGLLPDSVTYLSAARNIIAGNGIVVTNPSGEVTSLLRFPPAYPLLLSLAGLFGKDPLVLAPLFNVLIFALMSSVLFELFYEVSGKYLTSLLLPLVGILFLPFLEINSSLLSEPLFLLLLSIAIYQLNLCLSADKDALMLFLLCSLLFLTRYAGISFFFIFLAILLHYGNNRLSTLRSASLGGLPIIIFVVSQFLLHGSLGDRQLTLHLPSIAKLSQGLSTFSGWIVPGGITPLSLAIFLGLLLLILWRFWRSEIQDVEKAFVSALILSSIFYVLFLIASLSFVDLTTPLDNRTLGPVALLLFVATGHALQLVNSNKLVYLTLAIFVFAQSGPSLSFMQYRYENGYGYTSPRWETSETLDYVTQIPGNVRIVSNAPDVIHLMRGRIAYKLPAKFDAKSRLLRNDFLKELEQVSSEVRKGKALILYFDQVDWRWYLPSLDSLEKEYGFIIENRFRDGALLGGAAE